MLRRFPELPDWSFDIDEVSAGVYRAFGCDRTGRNVEASGLELDALIQKCRQAARELVAGSTKQSHALDEAQHESVDEIVNLQLDYRECRS